MPWGVVAAAVVGVYGADQQSKAGKKGANAQERANQAALDEQRRQFDINQANQQPWLQAGQYGLDRQMQFLNGDWSGFQNSPDYAFALDQGTLALDRGAAARGSLYSGGADADRIALGQGLATQYAGNYYNRLAGLSGTGQTAANQLGAYGQQYANNVGGLLQNSANARSSAYANSANAWTNYGNQLGSAIGQYYGQRQQPTLQTQPTSGYGAFTPNANYDLGYGYNAANSNYGWMG